jgi:hypothetical protein
MLSGMANADNRDDRLESLEDPAPTGANLSSTHETNAAPETASAPASEDAPEAAPESRARMERWDHGPPWESGREHHQLGRRSAAALSVIPVDVRRTPSPPDARLSEAEKELWADLISSRRPNWFAGAEVILECYVTTFSHYRQAEAWLAEVRPDDERYVELMRLRLGLVGQLCSLAVKLRLVPSARLDRRTPPTGLFPVA